MHLILHAFCLPLHPLNVEAQAANVFGCFVPGYLQMQRKILTVAIQQLFCISLQWHQMELALLGHTGLDNRDLVTI